MQTDFTGSYLLQSVVAAPNPPQIPAGWKFMAVYRALRDHSNATLELVQSCGRLENRFDLSGALTVNRAKCSLKGTARMNEPKGALFVPSEFGSDKITGRLALTDEGSSLEVKVCLERGMGELIDVLICHFGVVSRPARRDARLLGHWQSSEPYSSGAFSISIHRFWLFGENGRVLDSSQTFASSAHTQDGTWQGLTTLESSLPAKDRGTWDADGQTLTINWDDGRLSSYRYTIDPSGMIVRWSGGQKFWMRI